MFLVIAEKCKMKINFLFIILLLNLIFISAEQNICVDFDKPSPPQNLIIKKSGADVVLNWNSANDEPECSGIQKYDIYKNGNYLVSVSNTNYIDKNSANTNSEYIIHAIDKAGHNEGNGIFKEYTFQSNTGSSSSSSGGSSKSSSSDYNNEEIIYFCLAWENCLNGKQKRLCYDLNENAPDKYETRNCEVSSDLEALDLTQKSEINEGDIRNNMITGAFIKVFNENNNLFAGLIIFLISGLFIFILIKRNSFIRKK